MDILPKNFLGMLNINPDFDEIILILDGEDIILSAYDKNSYKIGLKKKLYKNGNSYGLTIPIEILQLLQIDTKKSKIGFSFSANSLRLTIIKNK